MNFDNKNLKKKIMQDFFTNIADIFTHLEIIPRMLCFFLRTSKAPLQEKSIKAEECVNCKLKQVIALYIYEYKKKNTKWF